MENTNITLKLIGSHIEVDNIKTFSFEPNDMSWLPGQYLAYRLAQAGSEEKDNLRYFTISSAPSEKRIDISTRMTTSAFKVALDALKTGDTIQASEPGGDFIWDKESEEPIILVAAGIGVTPFRSMILERLKNNQKIKAQLIYFNRTNDIAFLDSFKQIAESHKDFKFLPIIGEHVSADRILELALKLKLALSTFLVPRQWSKKLVKN